MGSDEYKDQILSKLQQLLSEGKMCHPACIDWIESLEHELALMNIGQTRTGIGKAASIEQERIMVANGHRLGAEESAELVIDNYDVILDLTVDTLQVRIYPERHSKRLPFELEYLSDIGPYRIKLLIYMLEHPGRYISVDNAAICHGTPDATITSEALRKTISLLRQALGIPGQKNPYIKTKRSTSPCSYALNLKWNYLLIKWKK